MWLRAITARTFAIISLLAIKFVVMASILLLVFYHEKGIEFLGICIGFLLAKSMLDNTKMFHAKGAIVCALITAIVFFTLIPAVLRASQSLFASPFIGAMLATITRYAFQINVIIKTQKPISNKECKALLQNALKSMHDEKARKAYLKTILIEAGISATEPQAKLLEAIYINHQKMEIIADNLHIAESTAKVWHGKVLQAIYPLIK